MWRFSGEVWVKHSKGSRFKTEMVADVTFKIIKIVGISETRNWKGEQCKNRNYKCKCDRCIYLI